MAGWFLNGSRLRWCVHVQKCLLQRLSLSELHRLSAVIVSAAYLDGAWLSDF